PPRALRVARAIDSLATWVTRRAVSRSRRGPRPMTHPDPAARELLDEIARWPIFDPHSHIDPRRPAARDFDEVLGYHYYTELAHSAGMPASLVAPELTPRERVKNLAAYLPRIDNTAQYSWLVEIAQTFHGYTGERIDPS